MIIQRKAQIILALLVSIAFLFQNCATLTRATSQEIPITSYPTGAKIIVKGEEMDYTPLTLKLTRKKSHLIRIEKQGYNPSEIRIIRKHSALLGTSIGNLYLGGFIGLGIADLLGESLSSLGAAFLISYIGLAVVDFSTGANNTLSPKELNVRLTKIEGNPQPKIITIDAEQFQNIKWIRIKYIDKDKDEIVNKD